MKKVFIFLSIALFSALFALSCQSLSVSIEEVTQPEGRTFTCVFAQPDPGTKINVDLSNGKTTWKAGDKILINAGSSGTSRRTVTLTAGDIFDEGKKAIITIPGDLDPYDRKGDRGIESTYYAMYPADNVASGALYYNQAFSNQNDFLMAACNVGDTFVFYNLCGVIAYIVNDGEDYDFDQVVFSGKDEETVAYDTYQARVRDDGSGAYVAYTQDADSYNPLVPRKSCTNTVVSDGSTMNYIFLPGGTNFEHGFTFSFLSGGKIKKTASANAVKNVAPGYILKLGDISTHLQDYVPPVHVPAAWTSGAENLVVSNAANCYIVYHKDVSGYSANAGKAFKIPAVKGKSSTSVGSISSMSILWETYNGTSATVTANTVIDAVDYDASYVYFKMPESEKMHTGNALIAAKDAGGNILWSWHIWVPSSVVNPITNTKFSPTAVMDRNLGAIQPAVAANSTVPVEAYGLYYQWGRKDPFFTKNWKRNASLDLSFVNPGTVSTDDSVKNPTVWYYNNDESTNPDTNNWNSTEVTTLWDDSGKTIYDPCPEGYKTSPRNTSYAMWKLSDGSPGWTSSSYGWFKFGDDDPEGYGNVIVFPYAGYASSSSLSYGGARSVIWGATYSNVERGYSLYVRHDKATESTGIYNYNSYYKSYLCSVRCVVE